MLSHLDAKGRRHLFLLVAIGAGQMLAAIAVMSGIQSLFEPLISPSFPTTGIAGQGMTLAMMGAGFTLLAWLRAQERVVAERLGQHYIANLRIRLFDQLCRLPIQVAGRISNGSLLMRFIGDLNALRTWIAQGIARLLVTGTFTLAMLLWLASINRTIAAVTCLLIGAGFICSWYLGERLRQRVQTARAKRAALTSNIAEKSMTLPVVQVFAQQVREQKRLQRQSDRLVEAMIDRARVIGQLRGINELTIGLILLSLLFVGAHEIRMGRLEASALVSILGLLIMLSPSLRSLGRINEYWHAARVSQEKIQQFLSQSGQPAGHRRITGPLRRKGAVIKFEGVAFNKRLSRLDATIRAGEKVAIIGPNGAGKSTLLQLLVRLIDPTHGRITIAGIDIAKLDLRRLRRQISMVSPDLPLLRGTIRRNLRYRNGRADESELERIIQLCELKPLLDSLPNGLDSRITERGANLSPGQRQRLALARALLGNPAILLLDEPEINTDPKTRALIKRIISNYQGTLILITHDREFASLADRLWYMDEGSVREQGAPDELLSKESLSATFFMARRSA